MRKVFPTLVENLSFSPNRNGLAEKGFLGGSVKPSSRGQCERSFPSILINNPTLDEQSMAIHSRNPLQQWPLHTTSPYDTTRLNQSIVIFCQVSTAQKPTIALFKRHYGPGRTRRCSPMCTLGPGACKWYSVLGNLPSFSKLPHGG